MVKILLSFMIISLYLAPALALGSGLDYSTTSPRRSTHENESKERQHPGSHTARGGEENDRHSPYSWGMGMGVNFPDIIPIFAHLRYKRSLDFKLFVTPPVPFKIRVDMPDDAIKTKKGSPVIIRTPAVEIVFNAIYGPQYGLDMTYYPFDGAFFVGMGASFRSLELKGDVESNVNITTTDGSYTGDSFTKLYLAADAKTSQSVIRGMAGWRWTMFNDGYFAFLLGYTVPYHHYSTIKIDSDLRTGSPHIDETINAALADLKAQKESEMESQSLKAMKPVERLALPLIGMEWGWNF